MKHPPKVHQKCGTAATRGAALEKKIKSFFLKAKKQPWRITLAATSAHSTSETKSKVFQAKTAELTYNEKKERK